MPLPPLHILYSYKHAHTCSHCSHKGRTWMSLSLLGNFLLMGLQTISCFHLSYWFDLWPSHCLSRVQKLKIYLSGEGSCREKKKNRTGFLWYHLNLEHIPSFTVLFVLDLTQLCIWLNWENKTSVGRFCLFDLKSFFFFFGLFLIAYVFVACSGVVYRLPAFIHHIYWLPLLAFSAV